MTVFNIKTLLGWSQMTPGDVISFESYGTSRNIAFTVNATDRVAVYVSFHEDMSEAVLVGCSDGKFDCGFGTNCEVFVRFDAEPGTDIFLRSPAASHVVSKSDEESYTTPTPMGRRNSELDRVMQLVRINEQRRTEALRQTIAEVKAEAQRAVDRHKKSEPQVIETEPKGTEDETTPAPVADGSQNVE